MPRTTKIDGGGKRFPLNMRTTAAVRDRLTKAANDSGRSLAQEVEARLERSFDVEDTFETMMVLAYGQPLAGILAMMGEAMLVVGQTSRSNTDIMRNPTGWADTQYSYGQAEQAAQTILDAFRPTAVSAADSQAIQDLGRVVAQEFVNGAKGLPSSVHREKNARNIRLLGEIMGRENVDAR